MSSRVVRQSKFRHVFGAAAKKGQGYEGLKITRNNWEGSTYCAVNPKFVAIIVEPAGGGAFIVQPLAKIGRIERDCPVVGGHTATVLDVKWCPHHDEVIASSSDDCTVKIWQIPEDGLTESLNEPIVDLVYHQRRVGCIEWHPTASNILVSTSATQLCLWDVGAGEVLTQCNVPDILFSLSFNFKGDKLVTACKDKKIRVHNARTLEVIKEGKAHEGAKPSQACFLNDDRIFTTGFSKMSDRQYALWDKDGANSLDGADGPLVSEDIDTSNGVMYIFYDADTNVIYLAGKGDSVIRYFELVDESPYIYWLANYQSNVPMRGMGFMPKRGVNVNICEIARIYKLAQGTGSQGGFCEPIAFTVPRKSELYQDDLYPDTLSGEPSLTADEWFTEGQDAEPILMSMKDMYVSSTGQKAKVRSSVLTAGKKKPAATVSTKKEKEADSKPQTNGKADHLVVPAEEPNNAQIEELLDDIRRLKIIVKGHEKRISNLEAQLKKSDTHEEKNGDSVAV